MNHKTHWDRVYSNRPKEELGWYQDLPEPSLSLINKTGLDNQGRQLHVGVGSSMLIDHLLEQGHTGIIANDLSDVAIQKLQNRLGDKSADVHWIVDNIAYPKTLPYLDKIDLWHDRAVLHFLLKEEEQQNYFDLLRRLAKKGGHVIIGVFNLNSADKCSGLPVFRYDHEMIKDRLGEDFELVDQDGETLSLHDYCEDAVYIVSAASW